jgi:hypothetical protein
MRKSTENLLVKVAQTFIVLLVPGSWFNDLAKCTLEHESLLENRNNMGQILAQGPMALKAYNNEPYIPHFFVGANTFTLFQFDRFPASAIQISQCLMPMTRMPESDRLLNFFLKNIVQKFCSVQNTSLLEVPAMVDYVLVRTCVQPFLTHSLDSRMS